MAFLGTTTLCLFILPLSTKISLSLSLSLLSFRALCIAFLLLHGGWGTLPKVSQQGSNTQLWWFDTKEPPEDTAIYWAVGVRLLSVAPIKMDLLHSLDSFIDWLMSRTTRSKYILHHSIPRCLFRNEKKQMQERPNVIALVNNRATICGNVP